MTRSSAKRANDNSRRLAESLDPRTVTRDYSYRAFTEDDARKLNANNRLRLESINERYAAELLNKIGRRQAMRRVA